MENVTLGEKRAQKYNKQKLLQRDLNKRLCSLLIKVFNLFVGYKMSQTGWGFASSLNSADWFLISEERMCLVVLEIWDWADRREANTQHQKRLVGWIEKLCWLNWSVTKNLPREPWEQTTEQKKIQVWGFRTEQGSPAPSWRASVLRCTS